MNEALQQQFNKFIQAEYENENCRFAQLTLELVRKVQPYYTFPRSENWSTIIISFNKISQPLKTIGKRNMFQILIISIATI